MASKAWTQALPGRASYWLWFFKKAMHVVACSRGPHKLLYLFSCRIVRLKVEKLFVYTTNSGNHNSFVSKFIDRWQFCEYIFRISLDVFFIWSLGWESCQNLLVNVLYEYALNLAYRTHFQLFKPIIWWGAFWTGIFEKTFAWIIIW